MDIGNLPVVRDDLILDLSRMSKQREDLCVRAALDVQKELGKKMSLVLVIIPDSEILFMSNENMPHDKERHIQEGLLELVKTKVSQMELDCEKYEAEKAP